MNFEEPVPEEPKKDKKKHVVPGKRDVSPPPPAEAAPPAPPPPSAVPPPAPAVETEAAESGEGELVLEPAPVRPVDAPAYSVWEKLSPPARRKKQISTMETGSREVLALVRSIRENMDQQVLAQKALLKSLEHLPEAVDSVKQLSEYTGQHAEMLKLMHDQMETGLDNHRNMNASVNRFNDTLVSMDKTTQLLLERAQRSEQQLHKMLRRSQRRLLVMMLLMLLMFGGGLFALIYAAFPEHTEAWLKERNLPTLTSLRANAPPLEYLKEEEKIQIPAEPEPPAVEEVDSILDEIEQMEEVIVPPVPEPVVESEPVVEMEPVVVTEPVVESDPLDPSDPSDESAESDESDESDERAPTEPTVEGEIE